MEKVIIQRIEIDDPLYQQERDLRNLILLRPIGIPDYGWEKNDHKSWHFVALLDNRVIGCVVLVPLDDDAKKTQLIQMAVETDFQKRGIGKMLVKELAAFAGKEGVSQIQIHSREDVTNFYKALGFELYGEPFEEVGVKHRHMRKFIN